MDDRPFSEQIAAEVGSWPGVVVDDGELGELAFKVGRRELGHLHGEHAAHFGFAKPVWQELHAQGRIEGHPVFPGRVGPASRRVETEEDVRDVIELMRLNYDRLEGRRLSA
jgi:Luciferase